MKDFKYIIKKIIIGVGICLLFTIIKRKFLMQTYALEVNATPDSIILTMPNDPAVSFSVTSNTWDNHTYYSFPQNTSTSWPSGSSLYFTYPQNSGATYCSQYSNIATVSGRVWNTSSTDNLGAIIKFEDTTANRYYDCSYTHRSNYIDFICNEVPSNHGFNIQIANVPGGRWGILQQINFNCIISGEDISNAINSQANQNTQSIINNQNQNTQDTIDSQKVCKKIDKANIVDDGHYLVDSGITNSNSSFGITGYYSITSSTIKVLTARTGGASTCFYNANKTVISCIQSQSMSVNQLLTIPSNASYVRFSINKSENKPTFEICTNGNQALEDTLTDDNVSDANNEANSFFDNFSASSHGLSGIITAPLRLINSITSSTCSPLVLPLPFVSQNATLPCMSSIYQTYFSSFLTLYRLITDGIIAYWVLIKIFGHIKGMQNPNDDRIEVIDL